MATYQNLGFALTWVLLEGVVGCGRLIREVEKIIFPAATLLNFVWV
jgi:hypothetical protein